MSTAVVPELPPPPPPASSPPPPVAKAVPWYRQLKNLFASLCTSAFVLSGVAALGDPTLPHHLVAGEVALESKGTVAFHTDVGRDLIGICVNGALRPDVAARRSGLTLDYGSCSKRTLRVIPAAPDARDLCKAEGTTLVLKLTDLPTGCGAQLLWSDAKPPIPVPAELYLLIKGEPSILGSLKIASLEAAGSRSVEAAFGAILGDASGDIKLAASSMQLVQLSLISKSKHGLPIAGSALRADFAEAAMGRVTRAELDKKDRLVRWRWERFLPGVVTLLVGVVTLWAKPKGRAVP